MQDKPIRDERIVEAIESCRPQSDDVSDPALAFLATELAAHPELDELYERCQQLDARLAAAFGDVPVPEGLAQRILAGIEAAGSQTAAGAEDAPVAAAPDEASGDEQPAAEAAPATPRARKRGPRRWLAGVAVAASLGASVVIGLAQFHPSVEISRDTVLSSAIDFFSRESEQPGELLSGDNEPEEYPFPSRDVNLFAQTSFRNISGFLGFDGVAYDMTNRLGAVATLYVVKCNGIVVTGLPSAPPSYRNTHGTQGCRSVAWQSDGLLYVLVVGGSEKQTFESFLPIPGPVT